MLPGRIGFTPRGRRAGAACLLGVPHSDNPKPSWYGESIGHYEGDALVVDTIGTNDKTFLDNYRTPHTQNLHVIERWKMIEWR